MAALMPLADAQKALINSAKRLDCETIDIMHAYGRVAAQDIFSLRNVPSADMSAMDGYAICYDPAISSWQIMGECKAGHPPCNTIAKHQAARIFTGAIMPQGADTVIIQENVKRLDDIIHLQEDRPILGQHIRRKGGDFAIGDYIIAKAERINAAHIGHIIAAGHDKISVFRKAKIAIISTGDELQAAGENCADHQIPASNGPMIAALLHDYDIIFNDNIVDDLTAIQNCISDYQDCDVIVTIGGASVGDHDLIFPALQSLGADIGFMKVAIKPGKPIMSARLGNAHIIGLPGNPSSAYVTAILFLLPLLRHISGMSDHLPPIRQAITSEPLAKTGPRAEFLRSIESGGHVKPFASQDSGKLSTLSAANALIIRQSHSDETPKNTMIDYIPINDCK